MPGRLVFSTSPDGSETPAERMRIDSTGLTRIQSTDARGARDLLQLKHINTTTTGDGPSLLLNGEYSSNPWAYAKICSVNSGSGYGADFQIHVHPADGTQGSSVVKALSIVGDGASGANVTITDGNLKVASGHGIDFSATGDGAGTVASEVLDDYEEGSFTVTSDQGGWTISAQNYNRYVKIGELVHVQFYLTLTGSGDSNSLRFGGLPYSVTTNGYSIGSGSFKGAYMRTRSGTDEVEFYYPSENTSNDRIIIDGNEIGAGYVIATITYVTE